MLIKVVFLTCFVLRVIFADDAVCFINGKKSVNKVSGNFLSFSIDPAIILTGLNVRKNVFSLTSMRLAQNLSPAYVRIAGPSTNFVHFQDTKKSSDFLITPSMWKSLNEWFLIANLTPVFGLNDADRINGEWNPKFTLPLFDMSDKLDTSCFWQLGYDCRNISDTQYKEDLITLRHIFDAFPAKRNEWKIVGDIGKCLQNDARKNIGSLKNILDAVVWDNQIAIDKAEAFVATQEIPVWVVTPKDENPITFSSALLWAQQIGSAAKNGFNVIFRQPRLHELLTITPVYWVTFLHKTLMGRIVLDAKILDETKNVNVYSHCAKNQNSFSSRGAVAVMIVNQKDEERNVFLKISSSIQKSVEIRSYILTSPTDDSTETYLNGEKLSIKNLTTQTFPFSPVVRRAPALKYLTLTVPPKSISYFILPGVRLPVCIQEENEMNQLIQEIYDDQKINFSSDKIWHDVPKIMNKNSETLDEVYSQIERELESDERFYEKSGKQNGSVREKTMEDVKLTMSANQVRHFIMQRARNWEKQQRKNEDNEKPSSLNSLRLEQSKNFEKLTPLKQLLAVKSKDLRQLIRKNDEIKNANSPIEKSQIDYQAIVLPKEEITNIELTGDEMQKILKERIKMKAAEKNVHFTNEELNELLARASEVVDTRSKRGINMDLLRLKAGGLKTDKHHKHQLKKVVTQPVQSSEEMDDLENESNFSRELQEPEPLIKKPAIAHDFHSRMEAFKAEKLHPQSHKNEIHSIPQGHHLLKHDGEFQIVVGDDLKKFHIILDPGSLNAQQVSSINPNLWEIGEIYIIPKQNVVATSGKLEDYFPVAKTTDADDGINFSMDLDYSHLDNLETEMFPLRLKRSIEQGLKNVNGIQKERAIQNRIEENKESYFYGIGKPYDPSKIKINQKEMKKQKEILKKKLALKKKFKGNQNIKFKQMKAYQEEQVKHLQKRASDVDAHLSNYIIQKYLSKTKNLKSWQPDDILLLHNKTFYKKWSNSILPHLKLRKRNIESDNLMDYLTNEIPKDTKFIHPELDKEHGDYKLIFPNKDRIEIKENKGDTNIQFIHHTTEEYTTSTSTDENLMNNTNDEPKILENHSVNSSNQENETVMFQENEEQSKYMNENKRKNEEAITNFEEETAGNKTNTYKHNQKIPHKRQPNVLDKIFVTCVDFLNNLRNKFETYVNYIN